MNKEYTQLLSAVLENAKNLKELSLLILKESLKKKNTSKQSTLIAYSQNILFACLDELGKFYLIYSVYPKKLNEISLKKLGFGNHDKKIEALMQVIRTNQIKEGRKSKYTVDQAVTMIRKFKSDTLYVSYTDNKIKKPSESMTLRNQQFLGFTEFVATMLKVAEFDLKNFKRETE